MRRLLLALIAGSLVVLGSAAPAQAHAELIGTSPGKGRAVGRPPAIVVLQFSEQVLQLGMRVQVTGPSGRVEDGSPELAGAAVVQKLRAGLPAGDYRVAWRVSSDDGHPVEGSFGFTATGAGAGAGGSAGAGGAASSASPAASGSASASAQPAATATGAAGAAPTRTSVPPDGSGPSAGWTIAGIAIVLAGLGAALLALTRPRRGGTTPPGADPPAPPND